MPLLKQICLAVTVAALAVVVGVWRLFIVNHLELPPVSLEGKTVLLTGATEGIGKETARIFAEWNVSTLILPVRNEKKGIAVRKEILDSLPAESRKKVNIEVVGNVDFAVLNTVRTFASMLENRRIDILLNNAGYIQADPEETVDGYDIVFQVNHLAPFLLTYMLLPSLKLAPEPRVVLVSSYAHYQGSIGTEKYSKENRGLKVARPLPRYDNSKLMNTMCAISFTERFANHADYGKITFNSLHPGFVVSNLDNNFHPAIAFAISTVRHIIGRNTRQGAVTQAVVATHPKLAKVSGKYFSDYCINTLCDTNCQFCDSRNPPGVVPNPEALDKKSRDWLWNASCEYTGLKC
jgi:NAD(P)-dependent dehydrogenase (short-subunit alcohol dehydrogenase family)